MQIGFKYHKVRGFGRLYEYAYKNTHMITKEAKQRLKIIRFWRDYRLKATTEAFGAKRSSLFAWWKIYQDSGYKEDSLNPKSPARHKLNKRIINLDILSEIRRLRIEVYPNMRKAKVKKYLDVYCKKNNLPIYSESKIGRIIRKKDIPS
jgi:transposase-like protein